MAEVRVVGTADEMRAISHTLGAGAERSHHRRDGGIAGYYEVEAPKIVCLDCETTGLHPDQDEILTLSIVDWSGNVLLDGRYGTVLKEEWPEASAVNNIYPEDVDGLPGVMSDSERIGRILDAADEVIAYNARFDLGFLERYGIWRRGRQRVTDTMLEYAEVMHEWDDYHEGWKWFKLTAAAAHVGYEWTGEAHGSLADALACLAVQKWVDQQKVRRRNIARLRAEKERERQEKRGLT